METQFFPVSSKREQIHKNIFFIALVFIVISLPFSLRLNSISIILLVLNWIVEGGFQKKIKLVSGNKLALLFMSFFFIQLLGLVFSKNLQTGFFDVQKKMALFILPLILVSSGKLERKEVERILYCFLGSTVIASFICLIYAIHRNNYIEGFAHPNWFFFTYNDLTSVIDIQPVYFGLYVCFSIAISAYFLIKNWVIYSPIKRVVVILFIFYLLIFLLLFRTSTGGAGQHL